MTKKKRMRKEEREHGQAPRLLPALDAAIDDLAVDDLALDADILDHIDVAPDLRAMERQLARINRLFDKDSSFSEQHRLLGPLGDSLLYSAGQMADLEQAPPPRTPLERAQELIYDAFESPDANRRVRLAKRALRLSPDCADAHVILAEESADVDQAREHYELGVKAGRRALGEEMFTEEVGNFWSILETRPYMRALHGTATMHWVFGEREEALAVYRRMLELNPGDNLGVRHTLATCLQLLRRDDELDALLKVYGEEQSAFWRYTTALHRFRTDGDGRRARAALRDASTANPYVLVFLLGRETVTSQAVSGFMGFGDPSEATAYFMSGIHEWLRTPGAIEWVRERTDSDLLDEAEAGMAQPDDIEPE